MDLRPLHLVDIVLEKFDVFAFCDKTWQESGAHAATHVTGVRNQFTTAAALSCMALQLSFLVSICVWRYMCEKGEACVRNLTSCCTKTALL